MSDPDWPLDKTVLAETMGPNMDTLLPRLLPVYLEDGDLLISWLAEALQSGDATKMRQAAHRLMGNSASMGVLTVAALAEELELLGKSGDLSTAEQHLTALIEEYTKVKTALLNIGS